MDQLRHPAAEGFQTEGFGRRDEHRLGVLFLGEPQRLPIDAIDLVERQQRRTGGDRHLGQNFHHRADLGLPRGVGEIDNVQ